MTCEIWQGTRLVEQKEAKTKAEGMRWIKSKVCTGSPSILYGIIFDGRDIVWTGKRVKGEWIEEEVEE